MCGDFFFFNGKSSHWPKYTSSSLPSRIRRFIESQLIVAADTLISMCALLKDDLAPSPKPSKVLYMEGPSQKLENPYALPSSLLSLRQIPLHPLSRVVQLLLSNRLMILGIDPYPAVGSLGVCFFVNI